VTQLLRFSPDPHIFLLRKLHKTVL